MIQETPHERTARRLGTVTLEPSGPIVAGTRGQWKIELTVGSLGMDEGGTIKIAQRFGYDGETPQFDHPGEGGYTTVRTTGNAKLRARYDPRGHERPWGKCIIINVYDGSLWPGDKVTVVLGDRSQGSPGIRAQGFIESAHEFLVLVDPTNACAARPVASSPAVPIVAGKLVKLICIVPTQSEAGKPAKIFVKGEDVFGNPTPPPEGVKLRWKGDVDADIAADELTIRAAGSGVVEVSADGLTCNSNPITAHAALPKYRKFWGDMHGQSAETVGTNSESEYFTFCRDWAALDFCSHQGHDFEMYPSDWKRLNNVVRQFHDEGRFVVFPGYEWSGNTSAGGDRNVWYLEEDMPLYWSTHWRTPVDPEDQSTMAETANDLYAFMRKLPREKVLLGSHVGGRYADILHYFDQDLGPLVELSSWWGVFEWMLWESFDKGYIVGVVCNSDAIRSRPGAENAAGMDHGVPSGLTCVLSPAKTRAEIFKALQNRRCYGTTGARIDVSFEIDGEPMGSVIAGKDSHKLECRVVGTGPLESVEVYERKKVIHAWRPAEFTGLSSSRQIRVSWRGAARKGHGRKVQWDGIIRAEGPKIVSARGYFDTTHDRIVSQDDRQVIFISQTTGDADWIDLMLDDAAKGTIVLESKVGRCAAKLDELSDAAPAKIFSFGGLGIEACIERYPEKPVQTRCRLSLDLHPPRSQTTPFFVKVTQVDGHMAWASPVYVKG